MVGVGEVGRIRVTDQRSRVSRRTRGEEALGPIESAYREQNGIPARLLACSPASLLSFSLDSASASLSLLRFRSVVASSSRVASLAPWTCGNESCPGIGYPDFPLAFCYLFLPVSGRFRSGDILCF